MTLSKRIFETQKKRSSTEVDDFDSIGISISSPDKIIDINSKIPTDLNEFLKNLS